MYTSSDTVYLRYLLRTGSYPGEKLLIFPNLTAKISQNNSEKQVNLLHKSCCVLTQYMFNTLTMRILFISELQCPQIAIDENSVKLLIFNMLNTEGRFYKQHHMMDGGGNQSTLFNEQFTCFRVI